MLALVVLNAYCFGANFVERFVNYQTWHLIPAEAFKAYHSAQQPLIQAFVVAPAAVGFVLQLWRRPARAPPAVCAEDRPHRLAPSLSVSQAIATAGLR